MRKKYKLCIRRLELAMAMHNFVKEIWFLIICYCFHRRKQPLVGFSWIRKFNKKAQRGQLRGKDEHRNRERERGTERKKEKTLKERKNKYKTTRVQSWKTKTKLKNKIKNQNQNTKLNKFVKMLKANNSSSGNWRKMVDD